MGVIEIGTETEYACEKWKIPICLNIHITIPIRCHKVDMTAGRGVGVQAGTEIEIGIGGTAIVTAIETGTGATGCRMDIDGRVVDGFPFPGSEGLREITDCFLHSETDMKRAGMDV